MRTIKFRFWDKEAKEFLTPKKNGDEAAISLDGTLCVGYIDGDMQSVVKEDFDFIPEQFTGLLDKNGKEIYEGDLVNSRLGKNWEVYFEPETASFRYGSGWTFTWRGSQVEVVGNIHEKK